MTLMPVKTVAEKMYIRTGMLIGFFNAPDYVSGLLGLPDGVKISGSLEPESLDVVLGFIDNRKKLETFLPTLKKSIKNKGVLWLAYHKGSSSVDTDINRNSIHKFASSLKLKGVAMVSINENWTGFRFKKV